MQRYSFWLSLLISSLITVICFWLFSLLLKQFGIVVILFVLLQVAIFLYLMLKSNLYTLTIMRWGLQIHGLTRWHYVTCHPQHSVLIFWWLILPRRMEPSGRFLAPRGQTPQFLRWKKNHHGWRTASFARQPERLLFVMFVAGMVEQLTTLITRDRWLIHSIMLRGFGNIYAATLFKVSWVPSSSQFDEMRRIDAFDLQLKFGSVAPTSVQ